MPEKSYEIRVSDKCFVAVEFLTIGGEVVSFVVRLMGVFVEKDLCIARYDTAHGRPHLDIVDQSGKLKEKHWLLGLDFEEAMKYAILDFKEHHETYLEKFIKES